MRAWLRYVICGAAGIAIGGGAALYRIHDGAWGSSVRIGPWTTGRDLGTVRAGAYTRAVTALRGLLALPAHEVRYYNAAVDSAGAPLDGKCRYRVSGGALPAQWWSLTLYDPQGYLVANEAKRFSVAGSAAPDPAHWSILVAPAQQPGPWLPTGRIDRFELTLRTYLPDDGGAGEPAAARMPAIVKDGC